jgi:hypothetical protein
MRILKPIASGLAGAGLALGVMAGSAAAQCEGGVTVAGQFMPNGVYVPGGCAYTNPTTPGQLYPSGAQPSVSTNPADGGSRPPGQTQPSDLIPVNSSDLGPAPSLVNRPPSNVGPNTGTVGGQNAGPGAGPAVVIQPGQVSPVGGGTVVNPSTGTSTAVGGGTIVNPSTGTSTAPSSLAPAQMPPSGPTSLTGNRADPSDIRFPDATSPAPPVSTGMGGAPVVPAATGGNTGLNPTTGTGTVVDPTRVIVPDQTTTDTRARPGTFDGTRPTRPVDATAEGEEAGEAEMSPSGSEPTMDPGMDIPGSSQRGDGSTAIAPAAPALPTTDR